MARAVDRRGQRGTAGRIGCADGSWAHGVQGEFPAAAALSLPGAALARMEGAEPVGGCIGGCVRRAAAIHLHAVALHAVPPFCSLV